MRVILYQLDGKIPNIALMRIAAHHRDAGDEVELRWQGTARRELWDSGTERVYASLIFEKTRPAAEELLRYWPDAIVGGTGWDLATTVGQYGITTKRKDYSIYPGWHQSIGFTQRGCRLRCPFCVVPLKEGAVTEDQSIHELWRGDPWPKELVLLDNDFFGQPGWQLRVLEMKLGGFKVSFCQGINARFLNREAAEAIALLDYRDNQMKRKCIYTAWDNKKDEKRLFNGLNHLKEAGVKPRHIMVYMLIGYWNGETDDGWEYRRRKLREFGCDPYPMPFNRTPDEVGFQRYVCGAYDKRFSWQEFKAANYRPEKLGAS